VPWNYESRKCLYSKSGSLALNSFFSTCRFPAEIFCVMPFLYLSLNLKYFSFFKTSSVIYSARYISYLLIIHEWICFKSPLKWYNVCSSSWF
jgi:hypothetical protein